MTRRRFWLLVHRCNGLLLAIFITVVGLTGSLLAWNAKLERVFAPRLFVLPPHDTNAPRADPITVWDNVAAAFPWAVVDTLDLSAVPNAPLEFSLTPKRDDASAKPDDDAFADPYSGRVLGSRRYGDLRQGLVNFMPFVYTMHESLALGDFGVTLLGIAALLWTCDCFVGMYLTFPATRRRVTPSWTARAAQWPLRWKPSWLVRWMAGGFKRLYDLHRASGLWLWAMLLVFAWTGVAFNLSAVYRPVMHFFGAVRPLPQAASSCSDGPASWPVSWKRDLADARDAMQRQANDRDFHIRSERFLSYDRATCRYTYRVLSTLDVDRIGNTQLTWSNGNIGNAAFTAATGVTKADTFTTWIEAVHESQIGGTALRMLVCFTGVLCALLSITGVWIFARKMNHKQANNKIERQLST